MYPPVYFYREWIDRFYSEDQKKDKVYENLCKQMDAGEVEFFAAQLLKYTNEEFELGNGQILKFLENKGILLDMDTCNVFIFEKNDNWKKEVKTFLLKLKEAVVDRKLKEIN